MTSNSRHTGATIPDHSRWSTHHLPWSGLVLLVAFILIAFTACTTVPVMEPLVPPRPHELHAFPAADGKSICVTPEEANRLLKFFLQFEAYADALRALQESQP